MPTLGAHLAAGFPTLFSRQTESPAS
jgi:hypothetical protein